ncbi:DUF6904 family protein [Fictibacillus macauensis]|uniref:DUF6904 family protein n=1 Tax=Fictibacillus macauensis TaxID=245160 RepID=UPI0002F9EC89
MNQEKRLKNITILAEKGREYLSIEKEVREAARSYNCSVDRIRLKGDEPDEIDW